MTDWRTDELKYTWKLNEAREEQSREGKGRTGKRREGTRRHEKQRKSDNEGHVLVAPGQGRAGQGRVGQGRAGVLQREQKEGGGGEHGLLSPLVHSFTFLPLSTFLMYPLAFNSSVIRSKT